MSHNPDPIFIHSLFGIEGFYIYWYGVMAVIGIIAAVLLAEHEKRRRKLPKDTAADLLLICLPLGILGARLFYVLFAAEKFHSITDVINMTDGGLALYGALAGGFTGVLIYSKAKKLSLLTMLDTILPGVALAQSIGRWGDFFNQAAFGPLVTNPKHMWFPLAVKIDALNEIHYAAFFYESVWCLLVFAVLWFVLRKRVKHSGDIALAYAALYSVERMFVELIRADSLMLGRIRISHLLSALIFTGCIIFIPVRYCREKIYCHRARSEGTIETEFSENSVDIKINAENNNKPAPALSEAETKEK